MPFLIALTGLSGAGKTTAIQYFENMGLGKRIYLGQTILDEVCARGLQLGPENERSVRIDVRMKEGPAALAIRARPLIEETLRANKNAFVDAIFALEELEHFKVSYPNYPFLLLAIEANFELRSLRLQLRRERPLTRKDLGLRDSTERERLHIAAVLDQATYRIINDKSLEELHKALRQFWSLQQK